MSFKTIKCSDIIDVRDGTHDSPKYLDKGYPLITSKNIRDNSIDFENVNLISEEDYNKINMRSSVKNGDILMPMIGTVGNPVLVNTNEKFAIKNVALFKLSENSEIDGKYFYYLLMSNIILKQLEKNKRGGTQSFVSLKNLRELKIPYISMEQQKKIVSFLDKSKGLIDKRKEQIESLDELVKSRFIEMFGNPVYNPKGWEMKSLSEIGVLGRGVSKHRPRNASELLGGDYPLIQTGDVANSGLYIKEYNATYSELGLKQSKLWDKGTLCITIAANIAKTGILDFDACFPDSVVGFIAGNKTNNIFMNYWFTSFQKLLEEQAPESAQKNINLKILNELRVIMPPIELQNQFADFVKQVDKLKFEMENSLKELEDNFNSLMQKAFK